MFIRSWSRSCGKLGGMYGFEFCCARACLGCDVGKMSWHPRTSLVESLVDDAR